MKDSQKKPTDAERAKRIRARMLTDPPTGSLRSKRRVSAPKRVCRKYLATNDQQIEAVIDQILEAGAKKSGFVDMDKWTDGQGDYDYRAIDLDDQIADYVSDLGIDPEDEDELMDAKADARWEIIEDEMLMEPWELVAYLNFKDDQGDFGNPTYKIARKGNEYMIYQGTLAAPSSQVVVKGPSAISAWTASKWYAAFQQARAKAKVTIQNGKPAAQQQRRPKWDYNVRVQVVDNIYDSADPKKVILKAGMRGVLTGDKRFYGDDGTTYVAQFSGAALQNMQELDAPVDPDWSISGWSSRYKELTQGAL